MTWTFYLDELVVDEPLGFKDLVIRARRDTAWHGIFFEASTSDLTFYGEAARYLRGVKESLGFASAVDFRAVWSCQDGEDVLSGRLDFRRYRESCGNECLVTLPVEQTGCIMTLRNRYEQKVDLSSQKAFNGITALQNYSGLNFEMDLPAQVSMEGIEGYVQDQFDFDTGVPVLSQDYTVAIRPSYDRVINNSITEGNLESFNNILRQYLDVPDLPLTPQMLLDDDIRCFQGSFTYEAIFKGEITFRTDNYPASILSVKVKIVTWDANGDFFTDSVLIDEATVSGLIGLIDPNPVTIPIDSTLAGSTAVASGLGLYAYLEVIIEGGVSIAMDIDGFFNDETYFNIFAQKECPPTEAVVSLVHETASRITEAITDVCLKVKSDYYGRTDSEPYAAAVDGCGSLRVLSSGLRIRNAENPKHFLSLRELFDGLNGIDNIGMGIEGDWLRIEPMEYFYRDELILSLPAIPKATFTLDPEKAYSIVRIGYKKWETEGLRGLDEFNSNKEFRTSLTNINNTIDLTSGFIAAGYVIEQTRQQSFAESGGADTKYDNDTFIICVERDAYGVKVEQGNIDNASGFFSPATAYNWRIRPWYNLMRWWKSLVQSYTNLINTTSKLIFSAGTGNLLASGELPAGDPCKLENGPKAENKDMLPADFEDENLPIWKAETVDLAYPMSLKDFNLVKANPYGYINMQCGSGDYIKAFIINLNYKPAKGEADLTLRLQWPTV